MNILFGALLLVCRQANADIVSMVNNALGPLSIFNELVLKICYILAFVFFAGAFIRYREHRRNPSSVRLSTPVMYVLLGLVFVGMPLAAHYTDAASVFSLYQWN